MAIDRKVRFHYNTTAADSVAQTTAAIKELLKIARNPKGLKPTADVADTYQNNQRY